VKKGIFQKLHPEAGRKATLFPLRIEMRIHQKGRLNRRAMLNPDIQGMQAVMGMKKVRAVTEPVNGVSVLQKVALKKEAMAKSPGRENRDRENQAIGKTTRRGLTGIRSRMEDRKKNRNAGLTDRREEQAAKEVLDAASTTISHAQEVHRNEDLTDQESHLIPISPNAISPLHLPEEGMERKAVAFAGIPAGTEKVHRSVNGTVRRTMHFMATKKDFQNPARRISLPKRMD
jgi:hypothetical protein